MSHHCFWDFLNLFVCSLLRKEWFLPVWIYFCGACWHSYPHFTCHFQARRLIWFPTMSYLLRTVLTCVAAKQYTEVQKWIRNRYQTKVIGLPSVKSVNVQHKHIPNRRKRRYRWTSYSDPILLTWIWGRKVCLWIIHKEECLRACKGGISIPNGKLENTED